MIRKISALHNLNYSRKLKKLPKNLLRSVSQNSANFESFLKNIYLTDHIGYSRRLTYCLANFTIRSRVSSGIPYNGTRRNFTKIFDSAGIILRNFVKFGGIPLIMEFRDTGIPLELFFDGIMETLIRSDHGIALLF